MEGWGGWSLASKCHCMRFWGHSRSLALWWQRTFWLVNEVLPGWVMDVEFGAQAELRGSRKTDEDLGLEVKLWLWHGLREAWAGHSRASVLPMRRVRLIERSLHPYGLERLLVCFRN